MDATVREKNRYGSGVEIVSRNGDCTVYRLFDSTGELVMTSYAVIPGDDFIYNYVHNQKI